MAKKGKFQIYSEYAAVRLLLGGLSILPRRVAVATACVLARAGYHLLGSLRRTGRRNLEIAFPEMIVADQRRILKGTFASLGRVLGEVSQFSKSTPARIEKIVDFELDRESFELYERIKREKRGVVITTGHLGNWELLVFAFAALHEPINYMARALDNPLIEELTVKIRTRFGNRPLNKTNSALPAIKLLKAGEIVGILADINAHPKEGVFVPFFGLDACTTMGPAMLAIRSNSLIFPTFCVFDQQAARYKIVHGNVIEPARSDDRRRDIVETTAAFTAEIERIIRQYPDQWLWIHKRWKTRPSGEEGVYQ